MQPSDFVATFRKGKAGQAYFLRGPDRFLQEECRKAVVNSIPEDARQWCLAEIEFQPERLRQDLEAALQMPMLGGHNFLLFSDPEDFKLAAEEDVEALRAYLERPSPFSTVVFAAVEPDRRRKFIQLLEKKAELVEMRPLNRRQAALWASDFLHQAGVEIEAGLAEEIASKFEISNDWRAEAKTSGVNLLWMRTEIEKLLIAMPGKKRWEAVDLDLIVAFREEREIGKLLRAIAERKCGQALEFLRELLGSKVAETLIVWCVGDLRRGPGRLVAPRESLFDLGNRPARSAELSAPGIAAGASGRPPHRPGNQIVVEGFKNPLGVSGLAGGDRQGNLRRAYDWRRTPRAGRRRVISSVAPGANFMARRILEVVLRGTPRGEVGEP